MIHQVAANTIRNGLAAVRRARGLSRELTPVRTLSGGEDGLYRATLANGDVVELTIRRGPAEVT